jgi:hypothetical protein
MALLDIEHIQAKDEVIQGVRKINDDLAKAFAYDLKKMLDAARMRQKTSGHTILSPPARQNA